MIKKIEDLSPLVLVMINFGIVVLLGFIDYLTGEEFSFYVYYFVPIILVTWYAGKKIGISFSFICVVAWFLAKYFNHFFYSSNLIFIVNLIMRAFIFWITAFLISLLKNRFEKLYELDRTRQKEKIMIETTQSMIGIIAEFITTNNSKIIEWIENKRRTGNQVPETVARASNAIGQSLQALTEVTFMKGSKDEAHDDTDDYIKSLKQKVDSLIMKYKSETIK